MRLLYSLLIFWPLSIINIVLTFMSYKLFGKLQGTEAASRVATNWGYLQYHLALSQLKIKGVENIPKEGGVIITSNHRSYFDIFTICAAMPRDVRWVVKNTLMHYPILGFVLRNIRAVGLDRGNPRDAVKALMQTAKELQSGDVIAMFPEGTRSTTEEMLPFKSGAFALALKAGVPVVPVAIEGSEKVLAAKKLIMNCCKQVNITFLEPIDPKQFGKDRQLMSDEISKRILTHINRGC